jgi:myo-inositol-1(or 4)-monophosphatase
MIALASAVAREAGALIRAGREHMQVDHKGAVDLVTQLDLASEALIRERFTQAEPSIPILAEEEGGAVTSTTRWIVDPLDGTTNFVHGFPFYCVSIALEVDSELSIGVIYDIPNDRLYRAEKGGGATCNSRPLQVSQCSTLNSALVASGFAYDRRLRADFYLAYVKHFLENAQGFRRCGSAAMDLAMLADGKLDAYWEFGLNSWDVAAGTLILQEAGGQVSDVAGGPLDLNHPRILATNGHLHTQMIDQIGTILDPT